MSDVFMDLVAAGLTEMVDGKLEISAAGWLCIALARVYGANTSEEDRTRSIVAISDLLDGARRRGFANTGILLTLAASGAEARCFAALAQSAMDGATPEEVAAAMSLEEHEGQRAVVNDGLIDN